MPRLKLSANQEYENKNDNDSYVFFELVKWAQIYNKMTTTTLVFRELGVFTFSPQFSIFSAVIISDTVLNNPIDTQSVLTIHQISHFVINTLLQQMPVQW